MEIPPKHRPTGWIIGSGNNNLKDGGVDFLLTAKSHEYRVSSTHFIIKHDTSSGLLIIRTGENKKVMLDGKYELRSEFRAFSDRRHGFEIGDLTFRLAWTDFSSNTYKAQVSQLRKEIGLPEFDVSRFLEITPLDVHISVGDFVIQDTIAGGGFGVVFAGFRKSDAAEVAAKKIRRDENNFEAVEDEIHMLESIKRHPRILSMVGVHYGEGSRYEPGPHGIDEMYIFCMPLATADVWDIIHDDKVTDNDRIKFFTQFCDGLKFLHDQGVMHRDIKPANLAVVSRKPPQGIIIDFGFATFDRKSKEYHGTLPYVAPEMLVIAKAEESENPLDLLRCEPYNNSVDVWGLGLVGFELFSRKSLEDSEEGIDEEQYAQLMEEWAHHPWDRIVKLAVDVAIQMIHWDPAARISAEYALLSMLMVDDDPGFYDAKVGNKRVAPEDQGWTSLYK